MNTEQQKNQGGGGGEHSSYKVKLMVSYGGKIQARPNDHQLTYAGGDTKILTVDRNVKFLDIVARVTNLCNLKAQFRLKYQLPGEDLDALVSLMDDDDVKNMMFEYDRIDPISTKPVRLRIFLFPVNQCATPDALLNPDFLFGFDKEFNPESAPTSEVPKMAENGSDLENGAEKRVETEIRGQTEAQEQTHDSNVTGGTTSAYTAKATPFYWVPLPAGGYPVGVGRYGVMPRGMVPLGVMGNREQPVYNFVPVMPPAQEQKMLHVAPSTHSEGFAAYEAATAAGSIHPQVTLATTTSHESKVHRA